MVTRAFTPVTRYRGRWIGRHPLGDIPTTFLYAHFPLHYQSKQTFKFRCVIPLFPVITQGFQTAISVVNVFDICAHVIMLYGSIWDLLTEVSKSELTHHHIVLYHINISQPMHSPTKGLLKLYQKRDYWASHDWAGKVLAMQAWRPRTLYNQTPDKSHKQYLGTSGLWRQRQAMLRSRLPSETSPICSSGFHRERPVSVNNESHPGRC